nr:MAG TPA: hypothetical protein [Caudoviricetes sp.]
MRARGLKRVSNRCQLQPWGHMAPPNAAAARQRSQARRDAERG